MVKLGYNIGYNLLP